MSATLDEYSNKFVEYAATINHEVLDIGCAYGVATLAALEKGVRVLAVDIDPGHLEILKQRMPERASHAGAHACRCTARSRFP